MRAVVVQLFEGRCTERVGVVRDERAALPQRHPHARGGRDAGEIAFDQRRIFRPVTVVLEPPAELQRHAFVLQFLKRERRKRILNDFPGDQHFVAVRRVVAAVAFETEAAAPPSVLTLVEHRAKRIDLVLESRADAAVVQFLVLIIAEIDGQLERLDERDRVCVAEVEFHVVPPHAQAAHLGFVLAKIERDAVPALVIRIVRVEKRLCPEIAAAACARRVARERVDDLAEIAARRVIARSLAAAIAPEHPVAYAVFQTSRGRRLHVVHAADRRKITADARVGPFVVAADGVHDAADRVAAVEQRRGAFHDLDALDRECVDRLAVVARLRRERPDADAIRRNEDAIAVETADHRARIARTKRSFRNAGLAVYDVAEPYRRTLGDSVRIHRANRGDRLERRLFGAARRDRHLFLNPRDLQFDVGRHGRTRHDRHRSGDVAEAFLVCRHGVFPRRNVREGVRAGVVRYRRAAQRDELDRRVVQDAFVAAERHRPRDRGVLPENRRRKNE